MNLPTRKNGTRLWVTRRRTCRRARTGGSGHRQVGSPSTALAAASGERLPKTWRWWVASMPTLSDAGRPTSSRRRLAYEPSSTSERDQSRFSLPTTSDERSARGAWPSYGRPSGVTPTSLPLVWAATGTTSTSPGARRQACCWSRLPRISRASRPPSATRRARHQSGALTRCKHPSKAQLCTPEASFHSCVDPLRTMPSMARASKSLSEFVASAITPNMGQPADNSRRTGDEKSVGQVGSCANRSTSGSPYLPCNTRYSALCTWPKDGCRLSDGFLLRLLGFWHGNTLRLSELSVRRQANDLPTCRPEDWEPGMEPSCSSG